MTLLEHIREYSKVNIQMGKMGFQEAEVVEVEVGAAEVEVEAAEVEVEAAEVVMALLQCTKEDMLAYTCLHRET